MSFLRQRCQDDKHLRVQLWLELDGMCPSHSHLQRGEKLGALLEPHVSSDGPRSRQRSGLQRQSLAPAGRVTRALWLLPWLYGATATVCPDQLTPREDSPGTSLWETDSTKTVSFVELTLGTILALTDPS